MRRLTTIITLAFVLPLLGACGQTGDLYLPDEKAPPAASEAPADETKAS